MDVLNTYPNMIEKIPVALFTDKMLQFVIKKDPKLIQIIPDYLLTDELYVTAFASANSSPSAVHISHITNMLKGRPISENALLDILRTYSENDAFL